MKKSIKLIIIFCFSLLFYGCNQNKSSSKSSLQIEEKNSDETTESKVLFDKYLVSLLDYNSTKQFHLSLLEIEKYRRMSMPTKDSIALFEVYDFFESEIIKVNNGLTDDALLLLITKVLYYYEDSIDKVDINYLLEDRNPHEITIEW